MADIKVSFLDDGAKRDTSSMPRPWLHSLLRGLPDCQEPPARASDQVARLQQQVGRLGSLDSAQLAGEVMACCAAFGPDFDCITTEGLAERFLPGVGMLRGPAVQELSQLVDEGAQTLINAGQLADAGCGGVGDGNAYTVTRAGRTALADGTVEESLASPT